ncbi:unnamed protein product [Orchesella dallaii]|uniref:Uncharacterized protein n=1 Tax=Orchesella dallaii TaxID=48710 RepID=A0ABP1R6V6_9HEXA
MRSILLPHRKITSDRRILGLLLRSFRMVKSFLSLYMRPLGLGSSVRFLPTARKPGSASPPIKAPTVPPAMSQVLRFTAERWG